MSKTQAAWIAALCLLTSACTHSRELAIERASREYDCPAGKIKAKFLSELNGYKIYQVKACGTVATYACKVNGAGCVRESDDRRP